MSVRLLLTIVYQHLRGQQRHSHDCAERCAKGCQVREFSEALAMPVLPSEVAEAEREEARFKAMAAAVNGGRQ
jgi:hypothetical protein